MAAVNAFKNSGNRNQQRTQEDEDEEEWQREKERLSQRLREKREREERERRERQSNSNPNHDDDNQQNNNSSSPSKDKPPTDPGQPPRKKKLLNGTNIEYRYPSGSVYVGAFKDGKLHGFGVYKYHPSGDEYEGEWVADMKHGHGVYTYEGGDKYTGEWRAGKKHGKGTYTFTSGDEYIGSWKDDKIHGHGTFLIARNGNRYEGAWEESYRHGFGVLKSGNGDVYEGNWAKGKEDQEGVLTYANGNMYAGDWKAGQMDGKGIFVEKEQKFLVEHISGYLIAKVAVADDAEVDPDWNKSNKLYLKHMEKLRKAKNDDGSGAIGGGGGGISEEQFTKVKLEKDMYEKKYKELLAQKGATTNAEGEDDGDSDPDSLRKKLYEAREQRDVEKRRADESEAKERVLMTEAQESIFKLEQLDTLKRENEELKRSGGGGGGSTEEVDRLQRKCAELDRELAARRQAEGKAKADSGDPIEMKVKMELMEGELKMLRGNREELQKLREQHLDAQRNIMSLENKNEELLKEVNVLRQRANHLNSQLQENVGRASEGLEQEVKDLKQQLQDAQVKITAGEEDTKKYKKKLKHAEERAKNANDLEVELAKLKQDRKDNAGLSVLTDKKSDQVNQLQQQNADLQRRLEELQHGGGGGDSARNNNNAANATASSAALLEATQKVESLQSDYKKEKKKHKKAAADRDEAQGKVLALTREIGKMSRQVQSIVDGRVMVYGKVRRVAPEEEGRGDRVIAGVAPNGDALFVKDEQKGINQTVALDVHYGPDASITDMYDECRASARGCANGFNACVMTYGPMFSGKSQTFANLAPMAVQDVFKAAEQAVVASGTNLSLAATATCVEVCCDGTFDLNNAGSTGSDIRPVKDAFGAVVLEGCQEVPLPSAREAVVQFKGALQRRHKQRSHLIFTMHVALTHKITNAVLRGKLVLADLSGVGALGDQEDVESARFVNKSVMALNNVLDALAQGGSSAAVPYREDPLTLVLSDCLGGNCRTHILAMISPSHEFTENSAQALAMMAKALKVVNRPLRQFESGDVARLRNLVEQYATNQSDAQPKMQEITNLRDQ